MGSVHSLSIIILSIKKEERERGNLRRKEKLRKPLLLDYDIKVRVGEEDMADDEDIADDEDMGERGEKEMLL